MFVSGKLERVPARDEGEPSRSWSKVIPAAVSCGALGVLVLAASWMDDRSVQLPGCLLKQVTGIPCLGCGGMRALQAISERKIGEAFGFNPLFVGGVALSAGWLVLALGGVGAPERVRAEVARRFAGAKGKLGIGLGIVAAVHWGYLILFLK